MNHWLKRCALIAPPVVIIGVYTGYIPVGPEIRNKIDSIIGRKSAVSEEVAATPPKIEKAMGEVFMRENARLDPVPLKGGEILKKGASIATGEKSFAVISSRGPSTWVLKVGPNSVVNVDDLMNANEKTTLNLIKGGLLSLVKNKTKVKQMTIRTKFASFAIRGTTFAILTDGESKTVMTVKEGTVEAENFKTQGKSLVRDAHSYLVNREGESKTQLDLDAVDLYNWNVDDSNFDLPTMDAVIEKTGDLGPTPDDKERARQEILKGIDSAITEFKAKNEELGRELAILRENADQSREGLRQEIRRIDRDIKCIETSASECNLYSDKILTQRGFPRLWGNPKYRHTMVVELQKYLQERDLEVDGREDEAKVLTDLMTARMATLNEVEQKRQSETELETLVPKLQDARLRR